MLIKFSAGRIDLEMTFGVFLILLGFAGMAASIIWRFFA